jgi:hypothetical protein
MTTEPTTPQPSTEGASPISTPILTGEPADRVKRYARLLTSSAMAAGVFLITGPVLIQRALTGGDSGNYVAGGVILAFGLFQVAQTFLRYRQLGRYLRTGCGTKLEELAREAARKP